MTEELDRRLNLRIDEMDRRYSQHFELNDRAIDKAERTMNLRLDAMNELREAMKDQAVRMATRLEVDALDDRVQEIQRSKANLDGRLTIVSVVVSAVVSLAMGLILRLVTR